MKLHANVTKKRGDKTYHSYRVTLPRAMVEDLGWEGDDELTAERRSDGILLKRANG